MVKNKKREMNENLIKTEVVKAVLDLIKNDLPITMSEIAKKCGVAKGTLYNYFTSKEELMEHVDRSIVEPIRERNKEIFEDKIDPLEKLHRFIDSVFEIENDVTVYFKFMHGKRTVAEEMTGKLDFATKPLEKLSKEGIEKNRFVDVEPFVLAEMIYGTVLSPLKIMKYMDNIEFDKNKIKKDMITLIDKIVTK